MELKDVVFLKKKKPKRVGRGPGSGHGKTSGRGHKGAKARKGRPFYLGFEGGNFSYLRRIPKRGFTHRKKKYEVVNIKDIGSKFEPNQEVTPLALFEKGLIKKKRARVKILGKGKIDKPLVFFVHKLSQKARLKIEEVKGCVNIIEER